MPARFARWKGMLDVVPGPAVPLARGTATDAVVAPPADADGSRLSPYAQAEMRLGLAAATMERARGTLVPALVAAARVLASALRGGGTLLVFGNGGSAGDAQHLAAELVGRFQRERRGLPAIALTTDSSALTGVANDYGYEHVFRRQVEALGRAGDVAVGITTSGRSRNVLLGLRQAREQGMATILIANEAAPPAISGLVDVVIGVPGATTAERQQVHLVVEHILAEFLDDGGAVNTVPSPTGRVLLPAALPALGAALRASGHRVVWTNGVFDLLHAGHLTLLEFARDQGDVLVVGLNSDRSTRVLKGFGRPVVTEAERARLVAALRPVDYVVVFDELDPVACLDLLRPHVHVKDDEYSGRELPESRLLRQIGAATAFCPRVAGRSSTALIERTG